MPQGDDSGARRALYSTAGEFRVSLAGRSFDTWEEVRVDRSIEAACGSFAVTVVVPGQVSGGRVERRGSRVTRAQLADTRSGMLYQLPFGPQDSVEVQAFGELLLTGHVDAIEGEFDKRTGTRLQIGGRDRAADMVDCSAPNKPGSWIDVDLRDLAAALTAPFGVPVTFTASSGARFPLFKLLEGETSWAALERACRMRGLLCFSDPLGGLLIEAPGSGGNGGGGRIAEGENLISARLSVNDADRFSIYTVRGQRPGAAGLSSDASVLVEANALDTGVRRYRPLQVLAEDAVSPADAETRAQWEAIVRATRAHRLVCRVPGWRRPLSSRLWRVNTTVSVQIPAMGIAAEFLIAQTSMRRSRREGTSTELLLARPDAYKPQPELSPANDPLASPVQDIEDF